MGDPRLRHRSGSTRWSATVDAVNGLRNLDDQQVAAHQAAVADRRIVTKADLAEGAEVEALLRRLAALNAGAEMRQVSYGAIDASELFGASLHDPGSGRPDVERWLNLADHRGRHRSILAVTATSVSAATPAHGDAIGTWLIEEENGRSTGRSCRRALAISWPVMAICLFCGSRE